MSLVITSNVNLSDRPTESEIHKPYSYSNRLTDTMKIDKNSEIAVQSVKINKNGLFSINRLNSTFAVYWGPEITPALPMIDTPDHPCIVSVQDSNAFAEYNTDEMASAIQRAISRGIKCPHYITGVGSVDATPTTSIATTIQVGAGGEFEGYDMAFTQNPAYQDLIPPLEADFTGQMAEDVEGPQLWTFNPANDRFISNNVNASIRAGASALLSDYPVSLNTKVHPMLGANLSFVCDVVGANGGANSQWCVGLSRYSEPQYRPDSGEFQSFSPPYYDSFWNGNADSSNWKMKNQFYDYVICSMTGLRNGPGTANGRWLRVFHAVASSNRNPQQQGNKYNLVMREIKYWEVAGSALVDAGGPYDIAGAKAPGGTFVGWTVDGEMVEPWIGAKAGTYVKIVDLSLVGTTKVYSTKPRGTMLNALYGKVWVRQDAEYVEIIQRIKPNSLLTWEYGNPHAEWPKQLIDNGTYENWGKEVETRPILDYNVVAYPTKHTYIGTDANDVFVDYQPRLILAPSTSYNENFTRMCNSQFLLGFIGRSLVDVPVLSGVNNVVATYSSVGAPRIISPKSLFIKLTNFTHSTANSKRGQKNSKILAHLPRFDNAGNEVGGLFFEPHERVYVALNNPSDMYINEFDVEIVYDNEELAKCISGKSIVCFHIRPRLLGEIK